MNKCIGYIYIYFFKSDGHKFDLCRTRSSVELP